MASHTAAVSMLRTPGGLLGDKAASNTAGKRSRSASHQPRRLYFSRAQRLQQPVVVNREYGSHRAEGKVSVLGRNLTFQLGSPRPVDTLATGNETNQ